MPRRPKDRFAGMAAEDDPMDFVNAVLDDGEPEVVEMEETRCKSKNLESERRRRNKLNQRLLALRALVPNITKMSKESTIMDAINYIKQLHTQVFDLQSELSKMADEEGEKQGSASSTKTMAPQETIQFQRKVEMSPIGRNKYHVNITYDNNRGWFTKLLLAIGSLGLEVTEVSSVTYSGASLSVFCVEAKDDQQVPLAVLKKQLSAVVGASDA